MNLIRYLLAVCLLAIPTFAQTAILRGQVTDESGAIIQGAKISLSGPGRLSRTGTSANDGSYSFAGLPAGSYTVRASAPGLALRQAAKIDLKSGTQTLSLLLNVVAEKQEVTVEDSGSASVSTDAASNASAVGLRGSDLDALSDNTDELLVDLQALAGPAAGPNGGSIFIDGFSGGELPPKNAIREIRINQNPFSPEYDKLGYGRIEIFTKPGTDKFHGSGFYNFADDVFNSRNPYAQQKAPFMLKEYGGNLSGPITKRASFFLDVRRDSVDNGAIINAVTLDPGTLVSNPFTDVFSVPQRRVRVSPRVDYQLTPNNTLSFRYGYSHSDIQDSGIGSFNLISRGYHNQNDHQHLQASETAVIGSHVVNEVRFQYFRSNMENLANSLTPAIQVLGSFNGGGAQVGHSFDTQSSYEFQDYISILHGRHSFRFGVRARGATDDNISPQNFGGSFTFAGGVGPQLDANNQPVVDASGNPVMVRIDSIERYRRTLLFQGLGSTPANIRDRKSTRLNSSH